MCGVLQETKDARDTLGEQDFVCGFSRISNQSVAFYCGLSTQDYKVRKVFTTDRSLEPRKVFS